MASVTADRVSNRASNPPSRGSGVGGSSSTARPSRPVSCFVPPPLDAGSHVDVRRLEGLSGFCDFDGREVWETCEENSRFGGTFAFMLYFCNVWLSPSESSDSIGNGSLRALPVTTNDRI